MIQVRNLTKSYGPHRAIDNLTFSVAKGEVVGFLGPNGAGKTTTMKIITGFMAPSSGSVSVGGVDVFENPIEVKKRIGYLPETPPVYEDMTVVEYLTFVAKLKGVEKDKLSRLVDRAVEKTQLGDVRNRLIQNLSKGFRQRVGISQALVSEPELLILDEPTVGLDPIQVAEIRNLIKELAGHHTLILSTHILPEVQASCRRIIIINRGKIAAQDTLESLGKQAVAGQRILVRLRRPSLTLQKSLASLPGVVTVVEKEGAMEVDLQEGEEALENLAAYLVGQNAGLLELRALSLNLEDIFIKLTSSNQKLGGET